MAKTILQGGPLQWGQIKVDFSSKTNTIPVVDFCAGMRKICHDLQIIERVVFDFPEGDGEIFFERSPNNRLTISCSYADGTAIISLSELDYATKELVKRMAEMLRRNFPKIWSNRKFDEWFKSWGN